MRVGGRRPRCPGVRGRGGEPREWEEVLTVGRRGRSGLRGLEGQVCSGGQPSGGWGR